MMRRARVSVQNERRRRRRRHLWRGQPLELGPLASAPGDLDGRCAAGPEVLDHDLVRALLERQVPRLPRAFPLAAEGDELAIDPEAHVRGAGGLELVAAAALHVEAGDRAGEDLLDGLRCRPRYLG